MNILLIEDDEKIGRYLAEGLTQAGNQAEHVRTAEEGLTKLQSRTYDATIVDLMLPGMSGEELLATLRRQAIQLPVLVLSAKTSVDDRIAGLRLGADDYVCKPFSFSEVIERLRAITRRGQVEPEQELRCGNILLPHMGTEVWVDGHLVCLRAKELQLLRLLVRNEGRIVSKSIILERIWSMDFDPESNIVDVLVYRLRKQLQSFRATPEVRTVRGLGYLLTNE